MTLVEVVAGTTLLATLATGMLLAYGAHQKQVRRAEQRIVAADVADNLLGQWYAGIGRIPRNQQGRVFSKQEPWLWRSRTIEVAAVGSIPVERIRVEIYREWERKDRQPLVVVELLAPLEESPDGGISGN
jgi:hypothetical protein